jgi:hypothetical protein
VRLLLLFAATIASASADEPERPPRSLMLAGISMCPRASEVAEILRPLVPSVHVEVQESESVQSGIALVITDLGEQYAVSGATEFERRFGDPHRACGERAKAIAVFVALGVSASAKTTSQSRSVTSPSSPRPAPSPSSRSSGREASNTARSSPSEVRVQTAPFRTPRWPTVETEIAAFVDGSAGAGPSAGGAVRWVVAAHYVGGSLGVGAAAPASLHLTISRAYLLRIPLDLSLRGQLGTGRWLGFAELGLLFTVSQVALATVPDPHPSTFYEIGVRAALGLQIWLHAQVGLLAGLQVSAIPIATRLSIEATGDVGSTRNYWIGGFSGLVVRIR